MPWNATCPMDERVKFHCGFYLEGKSPSSRLCDAFGVSRKTAYKWIGRYAEGGGQAALLERSKRPRSRSEDDHGRRVESLGLSRRERSTPRGPNKKLGWRVLKVAYPGLDTGGRVAPSAHILQSPRSYRSTRRATRRSSPSAAKTVPRLTTSRMRSGALTSRGTSAWQMCGFAVTR